MDSIRFGSGPCDAPPLLVNVASVVIDHDEGPIRLTPVETGKGWDN